MIFQWASIAEKQHPELCMLYHVPNGGSRHVVEARHLKASGVKPGVPDICLPVPRGCWHGLYIELKSETGRLTGQQHGWIESLREYGYFVHVCYGADSAIAAIKSYLRAKDESEPAAQE